MCNIIIRCFALPFNGRKTGHLLKNISADILKIIRYKGRRSMEIREKAYAKINISLDVVSRMENGWHEMCMVMQTVSLCDDIKIEAEKGTGKISVRTNRDYLPTDDRNIAAKAIRVFCEDMGINDLDFKINIKKVIPVCAGMGGGSADGAAALRAMNKMLGTNLDGNALREMGKKLGSDVPFCVEGGTALATGTGTDLEDLTSLSDCIIAVCKPQFSVSTPMLFGKIDCGKIKCRPDTKGIIESLNRGDLRGVGMRVFNVFEEVLPTGGDKVRNIKSVMYDAGALGSAMTGTGSAVFGVFADREKAENAISILKKEYRECFICENVGKIPL